MQAIVHQLGELFLQAAPTVLIILLFYFMLRALFFKPLSAVMAERDSRTVGAEKASEAAQAAAGEKVRQYQEALRQARAQGYAEKEAAPKKLLDKRAAEIKEGRTKAAGEIEWIFGKWLPPVFRQRAEGVSSAITKATNAKAAADAHRRDAQSRLANLQKEVAGLRALAEKEAAAEVARLRAATQSDAQKIAAAAKAEIKATQRAAPLDLKALAANLDVDGEETVLANQLTPNAQESLII